MREPGRLPVIMSEPSMVSAVSTGRNRLVWVILIVFSLGIRIYGIWSPPFGSNPTRSYFGALLARKLYYAWFSPVPEAKRIEFLRYAPNAIEPPILPAIAAFGYRIAGGEALWISRVLSALFWMLGAIPLYGIVCRVSSSRAGFYAVAIYLLAPFGIVASRAIQPDPLMVCTTLFALLLLLRYLEAPTTARLASAIAVSALAVLAKPPIAAFFLGPAFVGSSIASKGLSATVCNRSFWMYVFGGLVVPALWFGLFGLSRVSLHGHFHGKIIPRLIATGGFYIGWLEQIRSVVGVLPFLLAIAGIGLIERPVGRALLVALVCGYCAFGLTFTWHIHTRPYYSLPLLFIVAMGVGPVLARFEKRLATCGPSSVSRSACISVTLALVFVAVALIAMRNYRLERWRGSNLLPRYRNIAAIVRPSGPNVILAEYYGLPLKLHAGIWGYTWPYREDMEYERIRGIPVPTAAERLQRLLSLESPPPRYFVVADLEEFKEQDDLRETLESHHSRVGAGRDYVVYALHSSGRGARSGPSSPTGERTR